MLYIGLIMLCIQRIDRNCCVHAYCAHVDVPLPACCQIRPGTLNSSSSAFHISIVQGTLVTDLSAWSTFSVYPLLQIRRTRSSISFGSTLVSLVSVDCGSISHFRHVVKRFVSEFSKLVFVAPARIPSLQSLRWSTLLKQQIE